MALQQINLRIEQELLARMKAEARQRGLSLNSLASSAFERFLAGQASVEPSSNKLEGLAEVLRRLEVLEQKVAKQSQQAHHLPHGPATPPAERGPAPSKPAAAPPSEPKQMAQLRDGALSSAELAIATTTNRAAWNNWASDERVGQVRDHATAGQWKLMGKAPAPSGGPDRWMWKKV
jgi:hypothetical protein